MPLLDYPLLLLLPEEDLEVLAEEDLELDEFCCGRTYSELERDWRESVGEV